MEGVGEVAVGGVKVSLAAAITVRPRSSLTDKNDQYHV